MQLLSPRPEEDNKWHKKKNKKALKLVSTSKHKHTVQK